MVEEAGEALGRPLLASDDQTDGTCSKFDVSEDSVIPDNGRADGKTGAEYLGLGNQDGFGGVAMTSNDICQDDLDAAAEQREAVTIDEAFRRHVGTFGLAQVRHFALVTLAWTLVGLHTFTMMFTERVPSWHCVESPSGRPLPLLPSTSSHRPSLPLNASHPRPPAATLTGGAMTPGASAGSAVACSPLASICAMDRSQWEWDTVRGYSIVTEWDLVCGDAYKAGLVGSVFFTGFLLGAGVVGSLSDGCLGRRGALLLSLLVAASFGTISAFSRSFWVYLVLRGLTGLGLSGASVTQYILTTELFGPAARGQAGLATAYTYSLGQMIVPFLAYAFPAWRSLVLAASLPIAAYCCLVLPLVDESPRWLLVRGDAQRATEVLRRFAERNGRCLPPGILLTTGQAQGVDELEETEGEEGKEGKGEGAVETGHRAGAEGYEPLVYDGMDAANGDATAGRDGGAGARKEGSSSGGLHQGRAQASSEEPRRGPVGSASTHEGVTPVTGSVADVFRYPATRKRMLIMMFSWFTCAVVYYGISLNSINLGTNVYIATFMSGFVEWPAYIILAFIVDRVGRRALILGGFLLSGVCCLLGILFLDRTAPPDANMAFFGPVSDRATGQHMLTFAAKASSFLASKGMTKEVLRITCSLLGKFGISSSYALDYLYTGELFPTTVRNTALSIASQASQVGTIAAPWVLVLSKLDSALPLTFMGVLGIVAGLVTLGLPETLNQPLLETMEGIHEDRRHVRRIDL